MPSPLSVRKNNYIDNPKRSDIPTPMPVARFIASLFPDTQSVLDPCSGDGNLLQPFRERGCACIEFEIKRGTNFLSHSKPVQVDVCVCNPPFNLGVGKKLGSEIFLNHILEVCGLIPIALFVPMGFRLNQRKSSARWRALRFAESKITSILSLPLDIFDGVEFHNEVLFFNAPFLEPHYFLPEKYAP